MAAHVGAAATELTQRLEDDCLLATLKKLLPGGPGGDDQDQGWSREQKDMLKGTVDLLDSKMIWDRAGREGEEMRAAAAEALSRPESVSSYGDEVASLNEMCAAYEGVFRGLAKGESVTPRQADGDPIGDIYALTKTLTDELSQALQEERRAMKVGADGRYIIELSTSTYFERGRR